ncbi:uncharacterized protein N7511_001723 [Penicillium nucicola]|uniref:uncharacterized protein n=1 Tax=Penicillium nucicola TaxID=1850975 RepID=UPI002545719E|nr:uncharacterized protein N7511_001723 [Penicillium nucicola]KAJ5776712.1 hypothetical protein N7511_001723 [Penicillium nucicola]
MPLNTSGALIRMRLVIIFLTITWLAHAGLSSAPVRFAVALRDCAKPDLVPPSDSILEITFQSSWTMSSRACPVLHLQVCPCDLPEVAKRGLHRSILLQLHLTVVSLIVLSLGGYVVSHVRSFPTSFEFFDSAGHFPYYKIMYYGAVGKAAFGV